MAPSSSRPGYGAPRPSRPPSRPQARYRVSHARRGLPATRYGAAALDSEVERALSSPRGFRHKALFSAACRVGELVGGGEISESRARASLVELGLVLKPHDRAEVERTVEAGLERGRVTNPRSAPVDGTMVKDDRDARLRVLALLMRASTDVERWRGVAGASDLRVLVALSIMALHAGKLRVGASYRQIVELSGVSLGTVTRALWALEGQWVRRTHVAGFHRRADRSVFQLLAPQDWTEEVASLFSTAALAAPSAGVMSEQCGSTSDGKMRRCSFMSVSSERLGTGMRDPGHPLWRRRSAAWRVLCLLDHVGVDEGASGVDVASMLGMPVRTVYRNLAWLSAQGLVTGCEGVWRAVGDDVALELTAHLEPGRELVRERHRLDREQHRLYLASRSIAGRVRKGIEVDEELAVSMRDDHERLARRLDRHRDRWLAHWASVAAQPHPLLAVSL